MRGPQSVVAIFITLCGVSAAVAQSPALPDTPAEKAAPSPQASTVTGSRSPGSFSPAFVRYEHGMLSVSAHGIPLHSLLQMISQRTGTALEVAPGADAGPVYAEIGPASVHDVLTSLLQGLPVNYAMLGSVSSPGTVERLMILARNPSPSGSSQESVVAVAQPSPSPKVYGTGFATSGDEATIASGSGAGDNESQSPTALSPIQHAIDPSIQKFQQAAAVAAASGKSQAQILDELQKLQLQQLDEAAAAQQH